MYLRENKKPQKFIYPSKVPATFDASRLSRVDSVLNRLVADLYHMQLHLWRTKAKWYITKLMANRILKKTFPAKQIIFSELLRKQKPLPPQPFLRFSKKAK
jgi:hypothetical protein